MIPPRRLEIRPQPPTIPCGGSHSTHPQQPPRPQTASPPTSMTPTSCLVNISFVQSVISCNVFLDFTTSATLSSEQHTLFFGFLKKNGRLYDRGVVTTRASQTRPALVRHPQTTLATRMSEAPLRLLGTDKHNDTVGQRTEKPKRRTTQVAAFQQFKPARTTQR